ncbi:catechol 2,3-dioxygenase-like lactoylglutathione lyase family enzyme [Sphingobium sp. OAS761]|uniref:VOC family protein n=1 Tax=Sphingobium sp. OAS761 TaxID=2817901 RepID=UPI00209FEC18|nr:VOC family protein [Sphingobium sp. OAS761]MCP1471704.1 catechol 2,3-dioxygenase-like lactoylglutathione lyase family enzyme [Sphingobium sp. OAS761]
MGLRGVNRIMVAVRDLEQGKALYSDMLGATFDDAHWTGEPFGILVSIAWDAGIELCAPMPGREEDSIISPFLQHHGEGIMTVFFGVDDGDAAMARANDAGFACVHGLDYTQAEIDAHLGARFSRYQEQMIDSVERCGFTVALARLDPKPA